MSTWPAASSSAKSWWFPEHPIKGFCIAGFAKSDYGMLAAPGNRRQEVATRQIQVQRFTVVCSKSFEDVVAQMDAAIAHPEMKGLLTARTYSDLEKAISDQVRPSGLMEFAGRLAPSHAGARP